MVVLGSTQIRRRSRRIARSAVLEVELARRRLSLRTPPDFVIVGAQRSGTTSLYRALTAHQEIAENVLRAKGSHYLDTNYHRSERWFLAHFESKGERDTTPNIQHPRISGEACPYYLFHPDCARRLSQHVPNAKLIVLLREPADRAQSHYEHMVWEGHEALTTFEAALQAEPSRLKGESERLVADPTYKSSAHQHYSYMARGQYSQQIARLLNYFPRSQVHVVATETLTSSPERELVAIQTFLGLEPQECVRLERRNSGSYSSMRVETRQMLTDVFAESNSQLSRISGETFPWA